MPTNLVYLNLGGPSGKPLPVAAVAELVANLKNLLSGAAAFYLNPLERPKRFRDGLILAYHALKKCEANEYD